MKGIKRMAVSEDREDEQTKKPRTLSSRDWASGLPHNIMDDIVDRLVNLSDYIRFSSVCKPWFSTALHNRNHRGKQKMKNIQLNQQYQIPMLMLPHLSNNNLAQFYSVMHHNFLNFNLPLRYINRFIGSSCGWLISADTNFGITLFNPFSASTIVLPPVVTYGDEIYRSDWDIIARSDFNHDYFFVKAILSADPVLHPHECVLMVIYGTRGNLTFIKPGGCGPAAPRWTYMKLSMDGFCDVIYSNSCRLFYALLGQTGEVCIIDIDKEEADYFTPSLEVGYGEEITTNTSCLRYIVETHSGDLLQVCRFFRDDSIPHYTSYHTVEFKVYKLHSSLACYWDELKSLGDNALFLGDCTSMCVAASHFPGCLPGSIYFSLPFHKSLLAKNKPFSWNFRDGGYFDMGVANLEGKSIQPFEFGRIIWKSSMSIAIPNRPPIWILPTFQEPHKNRNWAALPHTILGEVLDRLPSLSDYIQFAAVCGSWRLTALDDRNHRVNKNLKRSSKLEEEEDYHQLPLLMLPHWRDECRAQFYSITGRKILNFQLPLPFYNKRFIGSSFGWLIFVGIDFSVTLVNPFSSSTIRLPPVITSKVMKEDNEKLDFEKLHLSVFNHEYYFVKAILSADPASYPCDYAVMVIYGELRRLAFIRPGSGTTTNWSYLDFQMQGFSDILYSKSSRLFNVLHMTGRVHIINSAGVAECVTPTLEIGENNECIRYIVETRGGDLLQVVRSLGVNGVRYLNREFKVFKLEVTPVSYWAEVKSFGDNVLFVGDSASMCVSVSQHPRCSPGSIYYLLPYSIHLLVKKKQDEQHRSFYDMGVANLKNIPPEPFEINYGLDQNNAIHRRPPIWVLPTFQSPY